MPRPHKYPASRRDPFKPRTTRRQIAEAGALLAALGVILTAWGIPTYWIFTAGW